MRTIEVYRNKQLIGSFSLIADIMTIGRAGDNDIVLPDDKLKVSRHHAVLLRNHCNPARFIIRDLSSSWGTKSGQGHIFQKILDPGDTIQIADFQLKYISLSEDGRSFFKISDESLNLASAPFPAEIGNQNTLVRDLDEVLEATTRELSEEIRISLDELLSGVKRSLDIENLLDDAMDILFSAFEMKEDCLGCFGVFEKGDGLRCLARKGMESRSSVPLPRLILEKIKGGEAVISENHLWIPLNRKDKNPSGFLHLRQGPYTPHFQENAVKLAASICEIIASVIENRGDGKYGGEEFFDWPRNLIGCEPLFKELKRVAPLDANVLLLGETGVGKEIAAEELHKQSQRSEKCLRKVNCPAMPKDLMESELFGHKKGAFTGATEDKKGEFELANGGTFFLDEIADLPWESQRKILRAIREKIIKRLGEEKDIKVDVRIVGATNRDLQKDMEKGNFGSDLYFSFGERIVIPPLRERKKDIPLLAHYFLDKFASEKNILSRDITPQAMKCLLSYSWPGNIRELRDCIGQALSKSKGVIFVKHLPAEVQKRRESVIKRTAEKAKPRSLEEIEKTHIMEALQFTRGNKEKTIEILKISKQTLYNKIEKYKIPADFGKI